MRNLSSAKRGDGLERTVIASQGRTVRLVKVPTGCRWVGSKLVPQKAPVDYIGVVTATGRGIFFDAKESKSKTSFSLHPSHVAPHQAMMLRLMGEGGAVAGLLIEAKHPELKRYYWLAWNHLGIPIGRDSLRWDCGLFVDLGDSLHLIRFENVPGVKE